MTIREAGDGNKGNGFVYAALRFALCPACAGMTVGCEDDMWEGA